MSKTKLMLGNDVEINLIFRGILGPLVLGWAPNHFVLGAQLAPGKKRLVCIPVKHFELFKMCVPSKEGKKIQKRKIGSWAKLI